MAKKEFTYRGKTLQELQTMQVKEFLALLPARERRTLQQEPNAQLKALIKKIQQKKKNIETHARDAVVTPMMVGTIIKIYNGKTYVPVNIEPPMIGHRLGEFALTRTRVTHSAPGVGATRSSASVSVR